MVLNDYRSPLVLLLADSNPFSIVRYFEYALYKHVNLIFIPLDIHEWFLKKFGLPKLFYKFLKVRFKHLGRLPKDPDLILVIEPYIKTWLNLNYFKNSIKAFYALDPHALKAKEAYEKCKVWEYDYVLCAQKDYIPMLKELDCSNIHWLPYAVDPIIFKERKGVDIKYDIAFLGSMSSDRRKILERLNKKFKLLVGQPGKSAYYMHDASVAYSMSKTVLQISNKGTLGARIFEGMACNRLVIADRIGNGLNNLFQDGENIVLYGNLEELEDKIHYYLLNDDERTHIALQGYNLVLSKHTYEHRVIELLNVVGLTK